MVRLFFLLCLITFLSSNVKMMSLNYPNSVKLFITFTLLFNSALQYELLINCGVYFECRLSFLIKYASTEHLKDRKYFIEFQDNRIRNSA